MLREQEAEDPGLASCSRGKVGQVDFLLHVSVDLSDGHRGPPVPLLEDIVVTQGVTFSPFLHRLEEALGVDKVVPWAHRPLGKAWRGVGEGRTRKNGV